MKNITGHVGTLSIIKRLPSSINGNARFLVQVAGFTCRTAVDSAVADDVKNLDGKLVEASIGTHFGVATLNSVSAIKL